MSKAIRGESIGIRRLEKFSAKKAKLNQIVTYSSHDFSIEDWLVGSVVLLLVDDIHYAIIYFKSITNLGALLG